MKGAQQPGLLSRLSRDQVGQTTLEYALILAAFGLPMMVVFRLLLGIMAAYYGMVTFLQTLPFS